MMENPQAETERDRIIPGAYWTHKREAYTVIVEPLEGLLTKDGDDANWKAAVAYRREGNDSDTFVRAAADFLAKFEANQEK